MSAVTDIILTCSLLESQGSNWDDTPSVQTLNDYLRAAYHGVTLMRVDDYAGGNKAVQCTVWMAAINHFDTKEFLRQARSAQWYEPESAQIFFKGENDDVFTVETIAGTMTDTEASLLHRLAVKECVPMAESQLMVNVIRFVKVQGYAKVDLPELWQLKRHKTPHAFMQYFARGCDLSFLVRKNKVYFCWNKDKTYLPSIAAFDT